jgi:hypothetical protein
MKDPYAKDGLLGYISVPRDFALISVGPDGVPDILPFQYNLAGKLVDVAGTPMEGCELSAQASQVIKAVPPTGRQPAWFSAELQIPSPLVYDPTNGVKSRGDIVYQASKNRSDCFGN